jgi:hypothetical protein
MRLRDYLRLNPFPATDPATAEFWLGIFPPDHHVASAAPTPAQVTTPKL